MGDVEAFILAIVAMLISVGLLLGWINYKINKLKDEVNDIYVRKENTAAAVRVLEGLIRNLNAVCQDHQKRLDILESGHPDSDFDYGALDDHDEVVELWLNGKKYVPEDKRDADSMTVYADGRIMAETTKPEEKRYCATCKYYSPGVNHTCDMNPFKWVSSKNAACNKYEKTERCCYSATKGQVDYPYVKLNHIAGDAEVEELLKRVKDLNYFYNVGLMSTAAYMYRWEELLQNDT